MPGLEQPVIDAAARAVYDGYQKRAQRDNDRGPSATAIAEAAAGAVGAGLAAVAFRLEPDEVAVDQTHFEKYSVGIRGVSMSMTMLVATTKRFWFVAHRDGAVAELQPLPFEGTTAQKKSLSATITVQPGPTGPLVVGPKSVVEWMEGILRDRPQAPVRLLANAHAAAGAAAPAQSAGHPAAWLADPTGRHQQRYWDGSRWTEHVSDGGVAGVDPVG